MKKELKQKPYRFSNDLSRQNSLVLLLEQTKPIHLKTQNKKLKCYRYLQFYYCISYKIDVIVLNEMSKICKEMNR